MLTLANTALRRFFSTAPFKVPIEAIKKLRAETSSPIGQCKKALEETQGDHEKALAWLRNKGMVNAEKKADKDTREGVVAAIVSEDRSSGLLLEVNCETDFVAKNETFLSFVNLLMQKGLHSEKLYNFDDINNEQQNQVNIDKLLAEESPLDLFNDSSIRNLYDEKKLLVSKLQENIRIRRMKTLRTAPGGRLGYYVHGAYKLNEGNGIGLQACLMELLGTREEPYDEDFSAIYSEFCDNIATQYLGYPPKYLSESDIPEEVVKAETEKVKKDLQAALKRAPEQAHERMIKGKLNATLYSQSVFKYMGYVLSNNSDITVGDYWKQTEKQLDTQLTLGRIQKWKCK